MGTIQLRGLTKAFDGKPAVNNLDLTVHDGEFVSLLGPSGCGKTTTLRCIAGLERPTSGAILHDDTVLASTAKRVFVPPEKRKMGMVFQSYALWPHMNTEANVAYPLKRTTKLKGGEIDQKVSNMLDLVGLTDCGPRLPSKLSGGQQQRVALARALISEPKVVLFDEPFSNLDSLLRGEMRREIRGLHERLGMTSIYVTHDRFEAISMSDRIVVMRGGIVQQMGTPREVYSRPANHFVADFMGFDNILRCKVVEGGREGLIRLGDGGPLLHAELNGNPARGSEIEVAVRASVIRVLPDTDDGANTFYATIEHVTYLGEHLEFQLRVGSELLIVRMTDTLLRARFSATSLRVLDKVNVRIDVEDLVHIEDETEGSDHRIPVEGS